MYKRNAQGWSKHLDFIIAEEISLQLAFILAVFFRHRMWAYSTSLYRNLGYMIMVVDLLIILMFNSMHSVVSRSAKTEAKETFKHCFYVFSTATIFVFATQTGGEYSRIILFLTFLLHLVFSYGIRMSWKYVVRHYNFGKERKSRMLVVTAPDTAEEILKRLTDDDTADYRIAGVILTEETGKMSVNGIPIPTDLNGAADYIVREWIDSVYIDAPLSDERVIKLMNDCEQMAVLTHYHVPNMSRTSAKRFSERVGGTTVITTSINYATPLQTILKRLMDIAGGIIGSLFALLIMAVVGPIIKAESPGPILFRQTRIGLNGKRFQIYKIRSMYMDAEKRKKELLEQNRVKDGMMFKLDFDPRIIGNVIMPDGTKKTGIGEFIRKTSLDEFPQFFNVLLGQMSMVGTRPPTVDEWEKYEYRHRARLATKPGITGMWQVSGRSEITDFEEIVRLDTEYITNFSIALDLKILFKTVVVLFTRKGAM